ncbi:MAG: hypothetical protein ACR2N9_08560 [Acidimicrobiia bacterium]
MGRLLFPLLMLTLLAGACTSSDATEPTTPTTTLTPLTTLASTGETQTTTTAAPTTTSEPSTTTTVPLPSNECVVTSNTTTEGYTQGCTVLDILLLAEEDVDPAAIDGQADRIFNMLITRPDLIAALQESGIEGRVIPAGSRITNVPDYADLYDDYPGTDWNRLGRSFPGTELLPVFSGAEENLLCSTDDRYEGEDIFVRTFAPTIRQFGLDVVDEGTSAAITQAYSRAIAAGLWKNTLAEINDDEYWMEGVQSYFDANREDTDEDRAPNSSHNAINTRDELADYDPALWAIANSVFGDSDWRPECHQP